MKIALATDHAGYKIIHQLKAYLESRGHECVDYGPQEYDENDDYPDYIFPAAQAVASGECQAAIVMGGSGQGEAMTANRIPGARCALYYGPAVANQAVNAEGDTSEDPLVILKLSREHNDANVLSLGARFLSLEDMKKACDVWLETPFSGAERHARRIEKLN